MITIKELQLDNETALKLIKLIKKEEPEIWKVLKGELTEALNIQNVSESFCKCSDAKTYYTRVMNCEVCENCGKEYVR
jgi:hypothetical protein